MLEDTYQLGGHKFRITIDDEGGPPMMCISFRDGVIERSRMIADTLRGGVADLDEEGQLLALEVELDMPDVGRGRG